MQDRYVGDVGDFAKYMLLRRLAGTDIPLGIVWYRNPIEEKNADGRFRQYLTDEKAKEFKPCDQSLFVSLEKLNQEKDFRVEAVRERRILPERTVFFEDELTFAEPPIRRKADREKHRKDWCQMAVEKTKDAKLIFLDPDNGLAGKSARPYRKSGPKFVFPCEITPYLDSGKSVVLYHHLGRNGKHDEQVDSILEKLQPLVHAGIWALTFHAWQARAFFIMPSKEDESVLRFRTQQPLKSPCGIRFWRSSGL